MTPKELRLIYKLFIFFASFAVLGYGSQWPAYVVAYYLGDHGDVGTALGYFILYWPISILLAFLISFGLTRFVTRPRD
jgi:hypothetical protein